MTEDWRNQTRTTRQVIDETLGTENWDLKALGITEVKTDFEKPLWVPVAVAEQQIQILHLEKTAERERREKSEHQYDIINQYNKTLEDKLKKISGTLEENRHLLIEKTNFYQYIKEVLGGAKEEKTR